MKILILVFLVFIVLRPTNIYAHTLDSDLIKLSEQIQATNLSELSEDESIEFIVENGIEIPDYLMDSPNLGGFVKWIIQSVETNPNYQFLYSYDVQV